LAKTATTSINKIISALRTTINGFDWSYAGTTFSSTVNSLISGIDWEELGKLAAEGIAKPLATLRLTVSGFDWGYAGSSFAATINGFFKNKELWADAGTIVSEAIKGLFKFGEDFFLELDTEQIANRIKEAVSKIDWHGIAEAMWKFLKAAIAGLGKGLADLLSPIQEEADDYELVIGATGEVYFVPKPGEGLHTEGDHWELDEEVNADASVTPTKSDDWEQEWDELVGDEISVTVDPTLPDNAGQVIEDEWARNGAELEAEVDLTKGNVDPDAQEIIDAEDKDVSVNANAKATGDSDKVLALARIGADTLKKDVNTSSKASGEPDKVLDVSKVNGTKVEKTVNTSSKASGEPDKVLDVSKVNGTKVEKTVNTSSKASGDPNKVLDVSKVNGTKVEKTVNTSSKASGDPNKVLDVSKVNGTKVEKTVNTSSKATGSPNTVLKVSKIKKKAVTKKVDTKSTAHGSPDKVLKVAEISSSSKTKKVDTKSKAEGEPNKVLDVAGISTETKKKDVYVRGIGQGDFGKIYKVITSSNNITKTVTVNFRATGDTKAQEAYASGGFITNGGIPHHFARGGVITGGVARYLANVPHYAGGTTRAHGTVFVAGEAGPEIMGHINGRTEILNKSQLAQTMYSAVLSAMSQAVSALGTFLSGQLANCTNAIVKTVSGLSGVANIQYHEPVMASGTVLPYDVAAQIARAGMDIQNTLDANNEDLIQTIISVAGQIVAAVQASNVGALSERPRAIGNRPYTAQQVINDINRRAQMFGSSPILN